MLTARDAPSCPAYGVDYVLGCRCLTLSPKVSYPTAGISGILLYRRQFYQQLLYITIIPLYHFLNSQRQQAKMPIYQARLILMPAWMKEPCMLHAAPIPLHIVGKATWPDSRAMWLIMLLLLPQQKASRLVYEALEDVRYNIINQSIIPSALSPKI